MINKKFTHHIQNALQQEMVSSTPISGGSISNTYRIKCKPHSIYFLKIASEELIKAEYTGLLEIQSKRIISTPRIISCGGSYLILEFIEEYPSSANYWIRLGIELAELHKCTHTHFGFHENNFIGRTPQKNLPPIPFNDASTDWTDFYWTYRLIFQYQLLEKKGLLTTEFKKKFKQLEKEIDKILSDSEEPPSLLHGDLWSGNVLCSPHSKPCLIDPAVYYGHREAELAMTRLFGGFPPEFYQSYTKTFQLAPGWKDRIAVYQLYHVMNHWNLFGSSYEGQAMKLISQYC